MLATIIPSGITEPGGRAVGHVIRVIGGLYSTDVAGPFGPALEYGYTHLARVADLIARDFPRDAEPL